MPAEDLAFWRTIRRLLIEVVRRIEARYPEVKGKDS